MKLFHTLLMIAGAAIAVNAQTTFAGPSRGYVFDNAAQSVRALLGVPGAAYLGPVSGTLWDMLAVAPNGNRALAVSAGSLNLIPDLSQPASFTAIEQIPGPIARVSWSSDSSTAAIWSPAVGQLQRITSLDSTPVVHTPIDLSSVGGVVSGWNLSPDGHNLAISSSVANAVYLSQDDNTPVSMGLVTEPSAVAFAMSGSSLFVFSKAQDQIEILSVPAGTIAGTLDASSFKSAAASHASPGAKADLAARRLAAPGVQDLAPSADGTRLYAIGDQMLCSFDLTALQTLSCSSLGFSPTAFQSLSGGVFLLDYTRSANMPLWLLDPSSGKVYFVPSGSGANASL